MSRAERKQTNKFTTKMQKKLVVLFMIVLLAFAGLSTKLILINKEDGESYKKQILSQQEYSSITLPYRRGDIVDSKGTKLATSEKVYNVILDTKVMLEEKDAAEPTINALVSCFGLDRTEISSFVSENPTSAYRQLAKRLTYEEINPFLELQTDEEKGKKIKGVWFEEEYKRVYPNGILASTIIGFTGKDNAGTNGLEEYYNDTLNGANGREYGYLNDDSTLERTTKAPVNGNSIMLTIDANIQSIVENKLEEFDTDKEYMNKARAGLSAKNVGCIIMDVNSGEVLAMADDSGFDPNDPKNPNALLGRQIVDQNGKMTDDIITEEVLQQYEADEVSGNDLLYQNLNDLWKNFTISSSYEPGSVVKPFTVATGLESGAITGEESYNCTGGLEVVKGEKPIRCHNRLGDGPTTAKQGIEYSCNVAMMKIAQAIGKDTFTEYQKNFNFGLKTNIDLTGEARTADVVYTADKMGPAELATNSFGQGFNVTMIETIAAFSSLVNGGYYYEPHVVKKIVNSDGATVKNIEPRILKQTVSQETSDTIIEYCNTVVTGERGTGKTARPAGYMIGGKTGTAETLPRGNNRYVVSFMGYAPAEDPQIAIYVVVEEPNEFFQDDAKFATRIVRAILTEVLPYLNYPMTEELSEKEIKELEERQIAVSTVSENEAVSGNDVSGNSVSDNKGTGEALEDTVQPDIQIDPETGYAIDQWGELVDPQTGRPVDPSSSDLE